MSKTRDPADVSKKLAKRNGRIYRNEPKRIGRYGDDFQDHLKVLLEMGLVVIVERPEDDNNMG